MKEPLFKPQTEWLPPTKFPDLRDHKEISIDLETKDPLLKTHGSGSVVGIKFFIMQCTMSVGCAPWDLKLMGESLTR